MLPISIKQQKTMKKSAKIQDELREIQDKYKNNPEKLNQETMELYKREKMNPFSGCLSGIIQIILLLSIFYLVRSPLTYMTKVDSSLIEQYTNEIKQEENTNNAYTEIAIIKEKGQEDERVYINMEFIGLDLSNVPSQNSSDWRVYIIPALYVFTSFVSIRITTNNQTKKKSGNEENDEMDAVLQANKSMSYVMPIISLSIAVIAPLGLALYWLVNNILMIGERLILNKFIKD
jgi:YidC/Oxa1 family membrane protein insertase